jgi:acetyl esterase/lipase
VATSCVSGFLNLRAQKAQLVSTMVLGADQLSRSITSATWYAILDDDRESVHETMRVIADKYGFLDHAHRSLQSNIRGRRHQRPDDVLRDTDITPFTRQYLDATPWQDPEVYEKTSPISTIKQAKTPTLIQQGSNDKRVLVPDSYELYRGLQDQGVESRMVLYSGFGHGVDKPKSQKALLQSNLDWFNHYLWNEPIPKDSPIYGTSELPTGK